LLRLYRRVDGVPIYLGPRPGAIREAVERHGRGWLQRWRRGEGKCFISTGKISRYASAWFPPMPEPTDIPFDFEKRIVNIVVMVRGRVPRRVFNPERFLLERGLYYNWHRTPDPDDPRPCYGFYTTSFDAVAEVVGELARRGVVEAAAIVNTICYAYFRRPVSLAKLVAHGFVIPAKNFKQAKGYIGDVPVAIYHNGTIRIYGPFSEEEIDDYIRRVYSLLKKLNAIVE